ncbi:hypothetical protein BV22DRAFT_792673 [Leucogyrophana mollusca]|uniref:Uncharacterized protein n=1 Tax=Leucogyrophana mollusca TaxID=85980 RepID=A0ACB8B6U5_9AGAM|nr:hypothetical protein BV22DRAFT_792673 [Leucogyrophana mollusca]
MPLMHQMSLPFLNADLSDHILADLPGFPTVRSAFSDSSNDFSCTVIFEIGVTDIRAIVGSGTGASVEVQSHGNKAKAGGCTACTQSSTLRDSIANTWPTSESGIPSDCWHTRGGHAQVLSEQRLPQMRLWTCEFKFLRIACSQKLSCSLHLPCIGSFSCPPLLRTSDEEQGKATWNGIHGTHRDCHTGCWEGCELM